MGLGSSGHSDLVVSGGGELMMSIRQVARYLNVTERTVWNLIKRGILTKVGFRVGSHWKFRKADIDRWIDNGGG